MKRIRKARTSAILPAASEPLNDFNPSEDFPTAPIAVEDRSMFARVGGFDGIMSMMGKVQQFFGIFQQMRPAIKMVGSFLGPKALVSSVPSKKPSIKSKNTLKARAAASGNRTKRRRSTHR